MISNDRIMRIESKLKENKIDITVKWDTAFIDGNDYKVVVVCNKDLSESIRNMSSLSKGAFLCQECLISKYSEKLKLFNFSFTKFHSIPGKESRDIEFCCNICGESRRLTAGNILTMKNIKCYKCRQDKILSMLHSKGCTFIEKIYDKNYSNNGSQCRVIYTDCEGSVRSAAEANILRGNFAPSGSHWEQKTFPICI